MHAAELPNHKTLTVAELVAELQEYLPDAPVYLSRGDGKLGSDFSVIVHESITTAPNCGVAILTKPA